MRFISQANLNLCLFTDSYINASSENLLSPLWMLGTDEMKTQEVSEGDSVTLHTGITEPQKYDQILWSFGPRGSVIAQIPERTSKTSFRDDERFRGRLQLDSETGDLTIRDVKITQSGDYQLKLIRARQTKSRKFKLILFGEQLTQYNNSIESVLLLNLLLLMQVLRSQSLSVC